ncbi:HNH endonuclease signature motif containing protein [Delftia sp. ASV31]|uniref:HNH endonuclease n=1 Tax=Delftia sp. ASV31 TaxID=2795113 RepID=UPI0018EB1F3F
MCIRDRLDAAHIIEVNVRGGNGTTNGILLRTDLHRLFDRNLLTIDESGRVILSAKLKVSQSYREALSGLQMRGELFKKIKHSLKARQEIFN